MRSEGYLKEGYFLKEAKVNYRRSLEQPETPVRISDSDLPKILEKQIIDACLLPRGVARVRDLSADESSGCAKDVA